MINKRNSIWYIILLLFSFAGFILLQSYPALVMCIFLIVLPPVSITLSRIACKNLVFRVDAAKEFLDKNIEIPVSFYMENTSFIPIMNCCIKGYYQNLHIREKREYSFSAPVYAKGKQIVRMPISSKHCGIIEMGVESVIVYDFLHLYATRKEDTVKKDIIIFPNLIEGISLDANTYISGNDDAEESQTKGSDFSDVSNIREYIPGDSLRDIHWKLCAKKDELMVKEHVSLSSRQIVFLVELYNNSFGILDQIMDVLYSMGNQLIKERRVFSLYWWSEECREMKERQIMSREQWEQVILELLYECPYEESVRARKQFAFQDTHLEHIIVVESEKGNEGETIAVYNDAVYVSYYEVGV